MLILRWILKLAAIPVMLAATLLQWIAVFMVSFSAVIFNLFAGLCLLIAALTYLMGVATGMEALRVLVTGFAVFLIPHVGEAVIAGIATVNYGLRDFIQS